MEGTNIFSYLLTRFVIISGGKSLLIMVVNISNYYTQFFKENIIYEFLGGLLVFGSIISLFLFIIAFITSYKICEEISFLKFVEKIKAIGIIHSFRHFIKRFYYFFGKTFINEYDREKNGRYFIILLLLLGLNSYLLPKGNILFYNFIGLYKEYDFETSYNNVLKGKDFIYFIGDDDIISKRKADIYSSTEEDEESFSVLKHRFMLEESGLFNGYKIESSLYYGPLSFIQCLLFGLFEIHLNTFIYIIMPFILFIFREYYKSNI